MTAVGEQPAHEVAAATLDTARTVAARLAARATEADAQGLFPPEDLDDLRAAGLLALMVPSRLGGGGASFEEYARVAIALGEGSGATALVFNMHASVTGALALMPDPLVRALGADDAYFSVRDTILSRAVDGTLYCVAMSERRAGARLSAVETRFERAGDRYRIVGEKTFVSGAGHAGAYLVAARASGGPPRVSLFLVPAGPGVEVRASWDALGMRASGSDDVAFDVEVGPEMLLGAVEGLALAVARLMPQWLVASYAAVYVGVAKAALAAAIDHVRDRDLGRLASVRARIGRADAEISVAELAVLEAARRVDADPGARAANAAVYRAKLIAGDTASAVTASLLEAAGTSATRRGHALERLFRDARCGALQPASSDLCADWLGVAALGGDPDAGSEAPRW